MKYPRKGVFTDVQRIVLELAKKYYPDVHGQWSERGRCMALCGELSGILEREFVVRKLITKGDRMPEDFKLFQRLANAAVEMEADIVSAVQKGTRFTAYRRPTGTFRFEKGEDKVKEPKNLMGESVNA